MKYINLNREWQKAIDCGDKLEMVLHTDPKDRSKVISWAFTWPLAKGTDNA